MCDCNSHSRLVCAAGVPGDAETAGHSAPPGAGEGATDAPGAAEAHDPNESPDACLLSALRPGAHTPLTADSDVS